jgi:hypothetical protein
MSEEGDRDTGASVDIGESPSINVAKLVELARQAYEQKRTKNCLDLTRAILLVDPDNAEVQLMRSSIRSQMHRDLESAQALVRDSAVVEKPEDSPAAEASISQATEEAALDVVQPPGSETAVELAPAPVDTQPKSAPTIEFETFRQTAVAVRRRPSKLVQAAAVLGVVILLFAAWPLLRTKTNQVQASLSVPTAGAAIPPAVTVDQKSTEPSVPASAASVNAVALATTDAQISESRLVMPPSPTVATPAPPRPPLPKPEEPIILTRNGTLAISSPSAADLYIDGQYIGSTPMSLQMSAGSHTVEYRHGDLRKAVTHLIKENETTRAMITFDISVSINANPWADVFLDGIEKRALGQTPLSGVKVPIGAVLVFQNPKFQAKRYRVTGNETGIQITFQ